MVHPPALPRDRVAHLVLDGRGTERRAIAHRSSRAPARGELDLRVGGLEASTLIELTAFGTAVVMNHRYTHTLGRTSKRLARRQRADMKIILLHNADALEPPVDPVLDQLTGALRGLGHDVDTRVGRP